MKIFNLNTINGKLSFIIFFLIFNFTLFGGYVLYQSYIIKRDIYTLNKHAEPSVTLTFISAFSLGGNTIYVLNSQLLQDTTHKKKELEESVQNFKGLINDLKSHTDTLGITQYEKIYSSLSKEIDELKSISFELIDIVGGNKKNRKLSDSLFTKVYNEKFVPKYWSIYGNLFSGFGLYAGDKETRSVEVLNRTKRIVVVTLVIILISLFISIFSWISLTRYFKASIFKIINKVTEISKGKLSIEKIKGNDEIAQIFYANNLLIDNLNKASDFANNIGKGNYNFNFTPVSEDDTLGKSLVAMRDELQNFKNEDNQRLWITEGYSIFGELLRSKNDSISELCENFIKELIKYVNLNQGSIFTKEEIKGEIRLVLKGCYAYSKKKYLELSILPGEGLVGQVYLEGQYSYITNVPEDYIKITSGLGEALPRVVLIAPIKIYEEVLGVVELASFEEIEQYKIDFILKICTDLASVIKAVLNNERTKELLKQVQEKSEQMYSQEEELRQNMEELLSTQEEMVRKEKSYLNTIDQLSQKNN